MPAQVHDTVGPALVTGGAALFGLSLAHTVLMVQIVAGTLAAIASVMAIIHYALKIRDRKNRADD